MVFFQSIRNNQTNYSIVSEVSGEKNWQLPVNWLPWLCLTVDCSSWTFQVLMVLLPQLHRRKIQTNFDLRTLRLLEFRVHWSATKRIYQSFKASFDINNIDRYVDISASKELWESTATVLSVIFLLLLQIYRWFYPNEIGLR